MLITDHEVDNSYKLLLEDIVGVILNKIKLYIDASGLHNGLRRIKDGHSYFGTSENMNDYVLNIDNKNNTVFHIYYDRLKQIYYFHNINNTNKNPIFYKLTERYKILNKTYILIGDLFFKLDSNTNISIKFIYNNDTCKTFSPDQSPVTIGKKECTINIESNTISDKHVTLYYTGSHWEVKDESSSGTWIWIQTRIELNKSTYIKIGNNIILISRV
jgi:3-deoxy-D-manno-octulosonate 8-phosphate phosphatase KdsC-like HAD superfamily phosphatase